MRADQTILIVEDDTPTLEMLRLALEHELGPRGYTIISAKDGAEALAIALVQVPALILLDLILPRLEDGLEVARRLRAEPATKSISIIAVSTYSKPDYALALGCNDYVHKPFDLPHLFETIERWLPQIQSNV